MKRGKRQRERLTSMSVVVQCAVQRAHQMDETRLAEANCVLLWKANEAMERKHLQHVKPFCCKVSALKPSVSGFCTWVGRRCKQLFSSGFGLQPFLLLGFIAFPALVLLLCTRVLHRTHTWTRGLVSASTYAGLDFKKCSHLVFSSLSGNQTKKIQIKEQHATTPSRKANWNKACKMFHTRYLNGWHLHDLLNILQRAGDVPQRRLVGQLHGSCIQRQKTELLEPGTGQIHPVSLLFIIVRKANLVLNSMLWSV